MKDKNKVFTIVSLGASLISLILSLMNIRLLGFDLAWIAIILCGLPIIKEASLGLVKEFDIKADVLVSMALIASVIIGEIFAAGEVAFIMTLGAVLERYTVGKARAGIEKLVHLTPTTARIVQKNEEVILPADRVKINDIIRVFPGETIAVDGIIISGHTSINQAVMTGEPIPIDKSQGDEVFSGTVNQFGTFDYRATKIDEDSSLQRMVRLVQSADASKAKIVGIADRWATWIVIIALVAAVGTWLVTGEIIRSVTILVVFCPCALVLATPTAIMAGIGNASKYRILIREGDALERLSKVSIVALDKTGTLTFGKPTVTQIIPAEGFDKQMILNYASSIESKSEHPIGKSIAEYFRKERGTFLPVDNFQMIVGKGVCGEIGGEGVIVGNEELLLDKASIPITSYQQDIETLKEQGAIIIYVGINNRYAGALALADILRDDAKDVVRKIQEQEVECILLSGDEEKTARYIADKVSIKKVHGKCLPETKMKIIKDYEHNNKYVCMIGDGINDALSLKEAHASIAMGGIGSDIAIEAADIALIGDDIKHIPHLLGLAKKTMKTISINLALSMILNFVAILLAMTGILNPVVGALVHNVGSVVVIVHSAMLLNYSESNIND